MSKRLSPMDAAWLYVDTRETPMHVGVLAIFALPGEAPQDFLRGLFLQLRETQSFVAPFNLKLRSARFKGVIPSWVEARQIDLDYHLRHSALPLPGGERELGVLVSRLHSHPMDFNRPLWECHIIEGLENNRFALYMKMHHSLVDGVGGIRMLQRMLSTNPATRNIPPPWAVGAGGGGKREPRDASFNAQFQRLLEASREQLRTAPGVAKALGHVIGERVRRSLPVEALPFSGPASIINRQISGQRRLATQHYDLNRIKQVATLGKVTVNDVFLAICAAALRRYLLEIRALPAEPLTAGVPVSVRPQGDENVGNAISFIIANLHTHLADPVERLHAIRESTIVAKQHLQQLPKAGINNYTMIFMAPFILQLLAGRGGHGRPMFNVTISNVPGPDKPLYFNGALMEQIYPVSLLTHGQAVNITVVSYAGQFNVGFTGCRDTLPHMQRLAVYTGEALDELETLLNKKPRPAKARAKAKVKAS